MQTIVRTAYGTPKPPPSPTDARGEAGFHAANRAVLLDPPAPAWRIELLNELLGDL